MIIPFKPADPRKETSQSLSHGGKKIPPGQSVMEQLLEFEAEHSEVQPTDQELLDFLRTQNTRTIGRLSLGYDQLDLGLDCYDATYRFLGEFGMRKKLRRAMDRLYRGGHPYLFELGFAYEEWLDEQLEKTVLPPKQEENRLSLVRYIQNMEVQRTVMLVMDNDRVNTYTFPPAQSPEEREQINETIDVIVSRVFKISGHLILYYQAPDPGKNIVNGFQISNGIILKMNPEDLSWAIETREDGSRVANESLQYQEAFLTFRY